MRAKKALVNSSLSRQNIQNLIMSATHGANFHRGSVPSVIPEENLEIDETAVNYLKSKFGIDIASIQGDF